MITKFKLSNRILSLVLALVMVIGLLPHFALEAEAVVSASTTFTVEGLTYTATIWDFYLSGGYNNEVSYDMSNVVSIEAVNPVFVN